ncbi:MAG: EamA family transporter, partial [Candidatus Coatesbacteria bacterium]|nr:EamA family transporter [Candidatus Coatesbacteria bacterium]
WVAGMKYTQISTAAILNQLSLLFIFVFAYFFLKEPMTPRRIFALILAFVGAAIVVGL